MAGIDLTLVEEAGLNALQTQRQLFYDGWLLRVSPGKAKRARSVNPYFGSTLSLDVKIDRCERLYAAHGLPTLFRMTPFIQPPHLDRALDERGYIIFQPTYVQVLALVSPPDGPENTGIELAAPPIEEFVHEVAALRGSSPEQRAAHFERLANTPLVTRAIVARHDGRTIGCGQVTLDRGLAGIYDMVTDAAFRGRGAASQIVAELLLWAWQNGATHAYLQVDSENAPALAVYRKYGFATAYTYHYRARPDECR
ncbi:MAG TPA: GNAT family N-acetyltransferase [Casimicrobiaceae bacterium]|jgi:GNAT superfamily N-acetyltransferase